MQELVSSETLNNEEEIIVFEENLKGPKGDKGDKGDDGYTPKKGVDYFTETDKQELIEAVTEDAGSEFVQIVNSKTTEFNNNATSKTESFNSNATSKLNEYNENHTSKMTAYNENSAEKLAEFNENAAEKIAEYDEHIEDLDNIVSKNTASGESIYIDDALAYKVFGAKVDGNAEQTTTTGKNLLKYQVDHIPGRVVESNGVTFTVNEDYSITINGTNNGNNSVLFIANGLTLPPGTYIGNLNGSGWKLAFQKDSSWLSWDVARTFEEETNLKQVYIEPSSRNQTYDNEIIYPMLVSGDTSPGFAKDVYEPYTGGEASPNPDYPQSITVVKDSVKIKQVGKNLANNNLLGYAIGGDDGISYFSSSDCLTEVIKCKPNTTYSISKKAGNRFHVATTEEEPVQGSKVNSLYNQASSLSCTITTPLNANFLLVYVKSSDGTDTSEDIKLQIEEGSVATDYEEYKSNEYTIDLNNNELVKLTDDIKDIIEIDKLGNVSLLKNTTKKIFNGTENWFVFDNQNLTNCVRFRFGYDINNINALCDRLQLKLANEYWTNDVECLGYSDTSHYIVGQIKKSRLDENASLQSFKDFLAENNLTVYHKLTEPTTSNLNQLTNFKTFEGVNHFFLETNLATDFEIKYAQDLQKVISKQQVEIDELKTLLSSTATSALLLDNYESDLINEIESEV